MRRSNSRRPEACSGAMYSGVPTTVPARVSVWSSVRWRRLAATHAEVEDLHERKLPAGAATMKTFSGFMSRWTMPSACAASRPESI